MLNNTDVLLILLLMYVLCSNLRINKELCFTYSYKLIFRVIKKVEISHYKNTVYDEEKMKLNMQPEFITLYKSPLKTESCDFFILFAGVLKSK